MRTLIALALTLAVFAPASRADQPPTAAPPASALYQIPPQPSTRPPSRAPRPVSASAVSATPTPTPALRSAAAGDARVERVQGGTAGAPALPSVDLPPGGGPAGVPEPAYGGNSISLQTALMGAVTSNPDLQTLRNNNLASPEAVEVARRFPTTLNPTLWVDCRPITLIPRDTFANGTSGSASRKGPFYHNGQVFLYLSLRQPVELGHQTRYRYAIAQAALNQQNWNILQAELTTVVQAYRFFQTAAYRREKVRLANDLADFNDRLLQALRRGLEANQVTPADVALAEVENQATRQQVEAAMQDYANALTDLRNQMGIPESAGTAEPLGDFVLPGNIPPVEDQALIQTALQNRPDLSAARAAVDGAAAAVRLARGDRIPTPIIGPEYQIDEAGIQYIGFVYITPLPVFNSGKPLVIQREAEFCRTRMALQAAEQRAATQVKAAASKWNASNRLISRTSGLTGSLKTAGQRPRTPLRPEPGHPRPAPPGPTAPDPARERTARRPLAGHPGPGRPAPGPGRPLPHLGPPPGGGPGPVQYQRQR